MSTPDYELTLRDVTKRYRGGTSALSGVTLSISSGLVALLGPNGAGKTTLMRILATVLAPTAGTFAWGPHDVTRNPFPLRRELGYLPQDFGAPSDFTGRQVVRQLAALRGLREPELARRVDAALDVVGLSPVGNRAVAAYSGGMRRRLGIAQAVVHEPRLLLVDEPTSGLDPEERIRFRALLAQLAQRSIVLLSTHIVADVEAVAGRIVVLAHGRVLHDGNPTDMVRQVTGHTWLLTIAPEHYAALEQTPGYRVVGAVHREGGVHVRLLTLGVKPPEGAESAAATLEDAYLLTMHGQGINGAGSAPVAC